MRIGRKEKFRDLSNFLVENAGTWTAGKCFNFYFRVLPEFAKWIPLSRPKRSWQAGTQGLIQIRPKSGYCSLTRSLFWASRRCSDPTRENKIWCSKLSEISWKIQMLKKLSNFYRISRKNSLNSPDLHYQFPLLFACIFFFFINEIFEEQKKSARIFEWETFACASRLIVGFKTPGVSIWNITHRFTKQSPRSAQKLKSTSKK